MIRRRSFLRTALGGALLPVVGCQQQLRGDEDVSFNHGVASGDPQADKVILWSRVSGQVENDVDVKWQVAEDAAMKRVVRSGVFRTGPHRDYTVKVDADQLSAGRTYFYQFRSGASKSPVGTTRTLPAGKLSRARFAVASCANHPYGYFHVYREIAAQDDLDAVLHLGDYIYEYGIGEYATERAEALGRMPVPAERLIELADYRLRHAQYKADPDSIAMHRRHPLIAIWDDHELANDSWRDGAENHHENDGDWSVRRDAAIQAWLEWMPVRVAHASGATQIFRQYNYGDLMSLILLDTRISGRDMQPDVGPEVTADSVRAALGDGDRRLLGRLQEDWLRASLQRAEGTVWQVIGQQVMVSPTLSPSLGPLLDLDKESLLPREQLEIYVEQSKGNPPMLLDTWNGYPVAREEFLADLDTYASNPVVLSGDLHTSLAGNLHRQGEDYPVAVEFMTTSVTSPGFAEYLPENKPGAVRDATLALNPSLRYMDTDRRGWLLLSVDREFCTAEWHLVSTVHEKAYSVDIDARWQVAAGRIGDGLQAVGEPVLRGAD